MPEPTDGTRHADDTQPGGPTAGDDDLVLGDNLAASILDELEPLHFGEAQDPRECEDCYRLRYRAVVEMRMTSAERFPSGLEHDEFDAEAVQLLGRDEGSVIATARLVLPAPGRSLPTERDFELRLSDGLEVVEFGRVVVDPRYRGDGHSVFMGLAAQAWLSMRARGFTAAIASTHRRLIDLFEALGFTVTVLGPARTCWGNSGTRSFATDGRRFPGSNGNGSRSGPSPHRRPHRRTDRALSSSACLRPGSRPA